MYHNVHGKCIIVIDPLKSIESFEETTTKEYTKITFNSGKPLSLTDHFMK